MNEVPTTPTATDRTMEARRIADETAKAKQELERIRQAVKEATAAGTDARKRIDELLEKGKEIEGRISKLADEEVLAFLVNAVNAMKGVVTTIEAGTEIVKEFEKKVVAAHGTLARVQQQTESLHAQAVRDGEEIERKTKDLNIYHARLKEYFEKYLPGQVIKL